MRNYLFWALESEFVWWKLKLLATALALNDCTLYYCFLFLKCPCLSHLSDYKQEGPLVLMLDKRTEVFGRFPSAASCYYLVPTLPFLCRLVDNTWRCIFSYIKIFMHIYGECDSFQCYCYTRCSSEIVVVARAPIQPWCSDPSLAFLKHKLSLTSSYVIIHI